MTNGAHLFQSELAEDMKLADNGAKLTGVSVW